ncbi:MATE family efflux transporter [Sneathia vaginalis]|uniref:MATE family efflux transporter n=1 Tax=Sneathia vaginalis TaxID=187101 RepID=UPI002889435B|nr:MATE family efflux transporter [Sneathia vaginalis]
MKYRELTMEDRRRIILEGKVLKTLFLLSIPTIMMAIVQAMIPFTDGLYLNHIIGPERTGAITYSQPTINIMLGLSQGLGVAAMAMVGQMAGKGDVKEVKKISLQVLVFGIFCGIVLIPISLFVASYISTTVTKDMTNDVYLYLSLYSLVIPFQFMASIFNSIKDGTGNPEASFCRMVVLLILKVFFNFIFLELLRLDIKGAVFASLSAYIVVSFWMYYDLFLKKYEYQLNINDYRFRFSIIKTLIKIGIPSMISYMMINLGFLLINMEISKYGAIVIAGLGIASNINSLCFQLPSCISTTVTTMVSLNIGVGNKEKAKKIYKIGLTIATIIALVTLGIIIPNVTKLTLLFTTHEKVLNVADSALKIYTYSILPYGIFMICQAIFNALGRTTVPLIMSFLRIWLFRYVFILCTQKYLSYYSVFYGNLFSNVVAAIFFIIIIYRINWESGIKYAR